MVGYCDKVGIVRYSCDGQRGDGLFQITCHGCVSVVISRIRCLCGAGSGMIV
jgi:hypothetical protein